MVDLPCQIDLAELTRFQISRWKEHDDGTEPRGEHISTSLPWALWAFSSYY
jgi:hypothetical protein